MTHHTPVLLDEVLGIFSEYLAKGADVRLGDLTFVDATLGAGGHACAILERFQNSCLVGFDQDDRAREIARERLSPLAERVRIIPENFSRMGELANDDAWLGADGVLFDLGVSSMQLVTPERGFSYQDDGPLDMRMDRQSESPSAKELLEDLDVRELTRIFRDFGEERHAFQIAKAIVRARERGERMEFTSDLVALIRKTLPAPVQRKMGTHPARRIFQALRIVVNAELDALNEGLDGARRVCRDGGAIVAISYHSLEDRIVKRTFMDWARRGEGKIVTRRPLVPGEDEVERNRSSRSAKLRAFIISKAGSVAG